MATRKKTATPDATPEDDKPDTPAKPAVVQSIPASLVPGSTFAARYKARMSTRG